MADTNTKTVSFKFVVDQQSFAQVKGALQELTQQAQKFAEAMKSAGGGFFGGGNVGSGVSGKSPAQTAAGARAGVGGPVGVAATGVKQVADDSVKALDKMTQGLRKNVTSQKSALQELIGQLDKVAAKYTGISNLSGRLGGALGKYGGPSYQGPQNLPFSPNRLPGMAGDFTTGGLGGFGRGGQWLSTEIGGGMGGLGLAGLGTGVGLAVAAAKAGQAVYGGARDFQRLPMRQAAEFGKTLNTQYNELLGGDISSLQAYGALSGTERETVNAQVGSNEFWIRNPWQATKARLADIFGESGSQIYDQQRNIFEEKKRREMVDAKKEQLGFQRELAAPRDFFEATESERIMAERVGGYGIGRDVVGPGGRRRGYVDAKADLEAEGYSLSADFSAKTALRSAVGNEGWRYGTTAMKVAAAGFSGYDSLIQASVRAGNRGMDFAMGGPLSRDPQMAIALGQIGLGTGFDPMGTTGGLGVLGTLQGAVGGQMGQGISTANLLSRAQEGVKAGEGIFSDSSPLQSGRNLLAAIQANPLGSIQAQTAMTQLSYRQALDIVNHNAPIPDFLKNKGVTKAMIEEYFNTVANTPQLDYTITGNDPESQAMGRLRASGLKLPEYLRKASAKERNLIETGLMAAHPESFSQEGAEGLGEQLANTRNKLAAGRAPTGGKLDTATLAKLGLAAKRKRDLGYRLTDQEEKLAKEYDAAYGAAGAQASGEVSAEKINQSMAEAAEASKVIRDNLSAAAGKHGGGTNRKTAPKKAEKKAQ